MNSLINLTASELSTRLAARQITSVELMSACLDRIDACNPQLNAIVALRPRDQLLEEARLADCSPRKGWLHGIPMAIKDLADTQGLTTTYGSPLFATHIPDRDCRLVQQLRSSGAIIIGKTNTPEFGLGSHTYNSVYGITRNPYNLACSAGGSSGGAAAALAARMVPVADGSDMMGSLRNPAAFNNVYGFRPSVGRVPADNPVNACTLPLSTSGPMARSVEDIARLLDTITEHDASQPFSLQSHASFAERLLDVEQDGDVNTANGTKPRIGWIGDAGGHYPMEKGMLSLCKNALDELERQGSEVDTVNVTFDMPVLFNAWCTLRSFDMAMQFSALYNQPEKRQLLKPELHWEIKLGLTHTARQIYEANAVRSDWIAYVATLFDTHDIVCLPSAAVFPFDAEIHWPESINSVSMKTYHQWMSVVVPASMAGLPTLSIPAGFNDNGLPAGLQLMGPYGQDLRVLQLGHAYHKVTDWPNKPTASLVHSIDVLRH